MIFSAVFFLFLVAQPAENANILFVTTFASVSHQAIFQPIWKELSLRGHTVTVITPNPLHDKSLTNLTEIDLGFLYGLWKFVPKEVIEWFMVKPNFFNVFTKDMAATKIFSETHEKILKHPEVQKVIHSNEKFDLVIAEWLFPTAAAFGAKFQCPLIGVTSLGAPLVGLDTLGNPTHPAYTPDQNLPVGRVLSFRDRLLSTFYSVYVRIYYHWVVLPREDALVKKYFGQDMPYLGDIERNISLLLLNRNPVFHQIMPVVPAVIELGGVRAKKVDEPLTPELKKFLDNSKNGVIYFSLGSNTLSKNLPLETRAKFIKAFEQVPYDVLWKWEDDELPGKPKNVFIQKWLPQSGVLAHPNVKLFIMQGGLQSMEETINKHVPIIGFPIHSDQTMNVDTAVKYGFGIALDIENLSVEKLTKSIKDIMSNSSYSENIKEIEKLVNDLPMDGVDKAMWWIEYVIRHKGAKHLQSPSKDIPLYQYFLLDVIAFVLLVLSLAIYIPYKTIKTVRPLLKKSSSETAKTKKE